MKMPTKCPICNTPLLNNTEIRLTPKDDIIHLWMKECRKKIDHKLSLIEDNLYEGNTWNISIELPNGYKFTWDFFNKTLHISTLGWLDGSKISVREMPFFEPDLSNYKKLKEKLNTYLIFM